MSVAITLGVSACIWQAGKVLAVERGQQPAFGLWSLPGGHVEPGESLEQAALRELQEETAIRTDRLLPVDFTEYIRRDENGALTGHYVIFTFTGRWQAGDARAQGDAAKAAWLTPAALGKRPVTDGLLDMIAKAHALMS
jgi:ADP-ribose pyrophosphatase YjhB (NUDIX family)